MAAKINYSPSHVASIETCARVPVREFAERCDSAMDLFDEPGEPGRLTRIVDDLIVNRPAIEEWFEPWLRYEQEAAKLIQFDNCVLPGLLQTADYARTLLDPAAAKARIDRQAIFARESPPEYVVIVDESVLHYQVGSAKVMHEQLLRLTDRPGSVRVQILPIGADTYVGTEGPFVVATVDGKDCVYVHTPAEGIVLDKPRSVARVRGLWDILRGEALPHGQSRDLILKAADEWQQQIT